jgi:restriction endonuclease S subunit
MTLKPNLKKDNTHPLPEGWRMQTLFELADNKKEQFDDGDWIESEHITTSGIRLIQTGNIGIGNFIDKNEKKYIYESSFQSLKCKELKQGDLLISRLAEPAGRACVLGNIGESKVVTSVDVTIFRPSTMLVDRYFLSQIFSTSDWFRVVNDHCGGTTHKRISRGALGRLSVKLPPLAEQRAIAEALRDMDTLLDGLNRFIAKKRDLKQAVMQQLITGKTRLPGFNAKWEVKKLKEIVCSPITDGPHLTPRFTNNGIPFLSVNNLVNNRISLQSLRYISRDDHLEFSKKCKPQKGDILFGKAASVGMVAVIDTDIELNIWSPLALIRVSPIFSFIYVYYALQASNVHKQIKLFTNSSSQGNIGMGEIGLLEIPLPEQAEQTAIAAVLSDIDSELDALEARRDKMYLLKQGMMQELLTGRTRTMTPELTHV